MYPYGLVGNCQTSALIGLNGAVEWLCAPRPDSPPVFGRLLDHDGGHFSISSLAPSAELKTQQRYLPNTNILLTIMTLANGDVFQITDFFRGSSNTAASIGPRRCFDWSNLWRGRRPFASAAGRSRAGKDSRPSRARQQPPALRYSRRVAPPPDQHAVDLSLRRDAGCPDAEILFSDLRGDSASRMIS